MKVVHVRDVSKDFASLNSLTLTWSELLLSLFGTRVLMGCSVSYCTETERGELDTQGYKMAEPESTQHVWLQHLQP